MNDGAKWLVDLKKINCKIMKENKQFFIGMDISKLWFDVSLMVVINHQKQTIITQRFDNTIQGIQSLHKWLKQHGVYFNEESLVVIENTGVYHRLIWQYCSKRGLPLHIGNAAAIKWSFGITRGKNDKIDSQRLCMYAARQADELKATAVLDPIFMHLKDLMTSRTRLVKQLHGIKSYLKELHSGIETSMLKIIEQSHQQAINGIKKSIHKIEEHIADIIANNAAIKKNYALLLSVPGIGRFTAVYLICCTNNFAGKHTGKQLASYAGVAPFDYTSGTSIKGKNRVHKMANKDLKKLLHLCALTAIKYYPEFRNYFNRKKAEGKNAMSALNAIRNKLVLRAIAVVNNQAPYVDHTKQAA
jgi:transposase